MKIQAFTSNAFAKSIEGGNPAGVVLDADCLSENDMKKIAATIGFSETAFVMKSDLADLKVKFFTPNEEVALCGHATIATFYTLVKLGYIKPDKYSQETNAGILNVEVKEDLSIMMEQNTPSYYEIIDKDEIADSLNITVNEMLEDLPVQSVSTGLRDILVPVKNREVLNAINPNFDRVSEISSKYNAIGYHIFTLDSLNGSMAHCRNLAPLYGIPEESATGTSNGALSCYLFKYGKMDKAKATQIVIEQGYLMKKPSEIRVALTIDDNQITQVKVGGKALNVREIQIEI